MTAAEHQICRALGNVRYLPATFDKRFGNNVSGYGIEKQLSEEQKEWIYRILYKYRKQLPKLYELHKKHPHCSKKTKITNTL
jgi:hypothetical protein